MAELQMKEQTGKFRFTFNGNIITELGEESISNSNIAIAELIKNAYDANSEQVSFEFVNLGKHNTTIRIVDGGVGMGLT
ncbi:MAG: ATP-binding protein, partial [Planctomycetes bacterium]|nr:ATP-binding protein [Planctomycetota bacterium]